MRRHRNWDVRLVEWQGGLLGAPLEWGRTDCGSLVRGALEAMYPEDEVPLPEDVPAYESKQGALRVREQTGGMETALETGGAEPVELPFAQQGDIVLGLNPVGGVEGAGVVVERHLLCTNAEEGVRRLPLRDVRTFEIADELRVWEPPHA